MLIKIKKTILACTCAIVGVLGAFLVQEIETFATIDGITATGDTTNMMPWIVILIIAAVVLIGIIIAGIIRKAKKK